MKALLFIFTTFFGIIVCDCAFTNPPPLYSTTEPITILCNNTLNIKWISPTSVGINTKVYLYRNISFFVSNLFNGNSTDLNGTYDVFIDCKNDYNDLYNIVMDNDGMLCDTDLFHIRPCGNGKIDITPNYSEECDVLNHTGCNNKCECSVGYYPILNSNSNPIGCCGSSCVRNEAINLADNIDLSDKSIKVNSDLVILNQTSVTINANTKIETDCFKSDGTLIFDLGEFVSFDFVYSKCMIDVSTLKYKFKKTDKCKTALPAVRQTQGLDYILSINVNDQGCNLKSKQKNKMIWLWVSMACLSVLVVVFILLSVFNKKFKNKIYPWRKNRNIKE